MLQIDLKPSRLNKKVLLQEGPTGARERNHSAHSLNPLLNSSSQSAVVVQGLNSYTSLNRATRIKDMAKIVEDNKLMLKKLQEASSFYSIDRWN